MTVLERAAPEPGRDPQRGPSRRPARHDAGPRALPGGTDPTGIVVVDDLTGRGAVAARPGPAVDRALLRRIHRPERARVLVAPERAACLGLDPTRPTSVGLAAAGALPWADATAHTVRALSRPTAAPGWFAQPGPVALTPAPDPLALDRWDAAAAAFHALGRRAGVEVALCHPAGQGPGVPHLASSEVLAAELDLLPLVEVVGRARLPRLDGDWTSVAVRDLRGAEHLALVRGEAWRGPCHVATECIVGQALGGAACRCRARLDAALADVAGAGAGMVVLLRAGRDELAVACEGTPGRHDPRRAVWLDALGRASAAAVQGALRHP